MVLLTSAKNIASSTSRPAAAGAKSVEDESSSGAPSKKLSLLVDYSKRKAEIGVSSSSTPSDRAAIFNSLDIRRIPNQGLGDHIDQALATLQKLSCASLQSASESPEQDRLDDTSHQTISGSAKDDGDDNVNPISFRLRNSSFRVGRCKSFDEKKLSSYENLQKSLRNLLQEESEKETSESASSNEDHVSRRGSTGTSASSPVADRRRQFARVKRNNHLSMRNITTYSGSTRNIMLSLGGSEHESSAYAGASSPRRSTLAGSTLAGRSRPLPNNPKEGLSSSSSHHPSTSMKSRQPPTKESLFSASEHSYLTPPSLTLLSSCRSSLMVMSESIPAGSSRRASLSRHSSGSRRNLLAGAADSSTVNDMSQSHFVTGSRIRRHGSTRNLVVEE